MMPKEAIDALKVINLKRVHPFLHWEEMMEVRETAIAALKKQVPEKPVYSKYDDNGFDEIIPHKAVCPVCGYEFEFGTWNAEENHHCVCGQAIDWSE